jgi:pyrimidine operon attenuation protein / uracil phosphoribosyltransferase
MNDANTHCLYDAQELDEVLACMARQLAVFFHGQPFAMVGILRRGVPLATMLQGHYSSQSGEPQPPIYRLKVQRYADDLSLLHPGTALTESPELAALDLAATPLLVVDDVLYEGHSLLRSCAYLAQLGARRVHTAVLVDRCVRTQPIQADVVGIRLQVAPSDIVECHVPPYEADLRIEIVRHGQHPLPPEDSMPPRTSGRN